MSEYTVWMRLDLQSSQWPAEATWAKGTVSWALELAQGEEPDLKSYQIYAAKVWRDGQKGSVALEAVVEAADYETAADLLLELVERGLAAVSARNSRGIVYTYNGGAVDEEGYQEDFLRVLKTEFAIEPEPEKPLSEAQKTFLARKAEREAALRSNLIELFGVKREESGPSV